jgi:hypothetical protein
MLLASRNTGRGGSGTLEAKAQQVEIVRLLTEFGAVLPMGLVADPVTESAEGPDDFGVSAAIMACLGVIPRRYRRSPAGHRGNKGARR